MHSDPLARLMSQPLPTDGSTATTAALGSTSVDSGAGSLSVTWNPFAIWN